MSGRLEDNLVDIVRQLREEVRINDQRIKQLAAGGSGGGGSGDMLKSVYDKNNDGIVDDAEKLNGKTESQLDVDKVDGHHASDFALVDHTHSGMGDMLKSVYDTDNNGVVDDADKVDGHHASEFALAGHNLREHGDVAITSPQEGDLLAYSSDTQKWENISVDELSGLLSGITYLGSLGNYCYQGVCSDGSYIYVTGSDDYLRKYRKSDGSLVGQIYLGNKITGQPHVGDCCYYNGTVYVAMSNYPTTPYKGSIIKVNADDLSYLGYISLYGDHEASSVCRRPSDGTFWVASYSYLTPCKIFKYSSSWEYLGSYNLETVDENGEWGYDGLEWDGNYLLANVHAGADQGAYLDIYYFNETSFVRIKRINHYINGNECHQGISFDAVESDVMWWVSRSDQKAYKTTRPNYSGTSGGGGVSTFLDLTDTPSSYLGQSGKVVKVKTTEDGLEFTDPAAPGLHHTTHEAGGDDAIKLDDLAPPDDNTDLNATTERHGLLPKLSGNTAQFLRGDGNWAIPEGSGGGGAGYEFFYAQQLGVPSGYTQYFRIPQCIAGLNTTTWPFGSANRMYAIPFIISREITISEWAIEIATAASGKKIKLVLYANGSNLYPGTLIKELGEIDASSGGVKTITNSTAFTPGVYWVVIWSDGTPTIRAVVQTYLLPILGYSAVGSNGYPNTYYYKDYTYGSAPDPYPSGATLQNNQNIPAVWCKV